MVSSRFLASLMLTSLFTAAYAQQATPPDAKTTHWAFQPIKRPAPPEVGNQAWRCNPIDAFILACLEKEKLTPSAEADRTTLIRRLKFDLLGLPPTPDEVTAFAKDNDAQAYEKLVDRYLAAPQFGERWARHWLDAVRFAESDGFETNQPRKNAWPYRDYVIRAFNEDKPYDRFIREQLAGDQLGVPEATGFLVGGPHDKVKSPDINLTLMQRGDELHDMINTTAATFLGLTVGCARCHDHKFDPISIRDYYGMRAVFAGVQHGERSITRAANPAQVIALRAQLAELEISVAEPNADPLAQIARRLPVNALRNVERFTPVRAKFVRFTIDATNTGSEPCIDELEIFTAAKEPTNVARAAKATSSGDYPGTPLHKLVHINDGDYGNSRSWISNSAGKGWVQLELPQIETIERIEWARDREGKYADRLPTKYRIEIAAEAGKWQLIASSADRATFGAKPPESMAKLLARRVELERQLHAAEGTMTAYAGTFTTPGPTHRLHRGDPMQKREEIAPASLASFGKAMQLPARAADAERRLALAQWIANPQNPLTARVLVNRLWHHHFGAGLVNTPSDFGLNGGKPSHPELIDWLASELILPSAGNRGGAWSMKHIHRLIVTSATYRQASAFRAPAAAVDRDARLLWRYPPRRLEAEALRDSYLFVSGKLDLTMGGPGFDLFEPNTNYVKVYNPKKDFGPAEWRRMIYQSKWRMQLDDVFGAFDCPDAGQITPKRTNSTTALQALNLLNSRFMLQQARFFAERLERETGRDVNAQVRHAFRLAFQREPSATEMTGAARLVREHGLPALCRALFNANEFVFVD